MSEHEYGMQRALELARLATGYTSPNPLVGAVVVRNGEIVGEGWHRQAGSPHAEVEALQQAGEAARGATLYVTLEPCNHHGRTPPCTMAIINAGIAHVVYAIADPNPHVVGGGHACLQQAGITVTAGVCASEAQALNRFFLHHACTGRPYVIAKFAMSLDGKIATRTGHSQWITGPIARERVHALRHAVDAILVGVGTVLADNPRLTTRLPIENPKHPLRIILDSRGRIPLDAHVHMIDNAAPTLIATTEAMPHTHVEALTACGVEVMRLSATSSGQVAMGDVLYACGQRNIQSILVEGGSAVLGSCFDGGHVNEVWAFLAPVLIGGCDAPTPVGGVGIAHMDEALCLSHTHIEQVGNDVLIRGYITQH